MQINKTDFMTFRDCASDFWMKKHKPKLFVDIQSSDFDRQLMAQGYEVERLAQKLFQDGIDASQFDNNVILTLLGIQGTVLFQPTFIAGNLQARVDILKVTDDGLHIYEVKASTNKDKFKREYYWDAGFQKEVIERAGHSVSKVFLVLLNNDFIKDGPIKPSEIFVISDITQEIIDNHIEVKMEIANAQKRLLDLTAPTSCGCYYKIRNKQCQSLKHFYSLPDYAVHDIISISKSKIERFQMVGVESVDDITQYDWLTQNQLNQVSTHQNDEVIIQHVQIKDVIAQLKYPLYFLDYETFPTAIPVFDGCAPYQQVPFQYSLHIQDEPDGPFRHKEYLHLDATSPIQDIATSLRNDTGDYGSILVWNETFEAGRNRELARANPEIQDFLLGLNSRFYDLMKIFANQWYVHKAFKGRKSIKKVLPVLCPDLTYDSLGIKDGGAATNAWKTMVFENITPDQKKMIAKDLLAYCKLDTWAMVQILEVLRKIET